ncbi:small secreted hydrophilic protein [Streptomyces pseudogriseolus]|uniref:small secreted hydrophilic protein n=1 Tax=Streptomyces pseudogriseolus TaxID=36817 RepID=UPI003FA32188
MAFTRRMAALAAVVLIPLGVAATSFALADSPEPPKVPPRVELDSGSRAPTPSATRPGPAPSDEVVSPPPVTDGPTDDDDDDDQGQDPADDGPDRDDGRGRDDG